MEFHVHTYAYLLVVGAMMFQILTGKSDQSMVYASRLLNRTYHNYSTIKREALAMVFALHKFKHYLLGNKFICYVHMLFFYLVNKPQVSGRISRWLLLFLKYDFTIMYKPSRVHVVGDALSRLLNITKPTGVLD